MNEYKAEIKLNLFILNRPEESNVMQNRIKCIKLVVLDPIPPNKFADVRFQHFSVCAIVPFISFFCGLPYPLDSLSAGPCFWIDKI